MSNELQRATTYHLAGDDIKVTFSMICPDDPEMVYEDIGGERKFSGSAIDQKECPLGLMVSVVLEEAPDLRVIIFSIAIPIANRPDDQRSVPVGSFAVKTTSRTSIAGPDMIEGQIQTYETYVLEGNAW